MTNLSYIFKYLLRLICLLLLNELFFNFCYGQVSDKHLNIGDTVTAIKLKVFTHRDNNNEISFSELKGKVVILEFWATWCGPCIPYLYTFSSIQNRFKDSICVIAISQESKDDIWRTISKIQGRSILFSSDTSHLSFFHYNVIPTSIVIDKNSIIKAITTPAEITEAKISKLLASEDVQFASGKKTTPTKSPQLKEHTNFYEVEVTGYDSTGATGIEIDTVSSVRKLVFSNFTLPSLFREVFKMPAHSWLIDSTGEVGLSEYSPENMFCIKLTIPNFSGNELYDEAKRIINSCFPYIGKKIAKKEEVYELSYHPTGTATLKNISGTKSVFSYYGPNFNGKAVNIKTLISYLSNELGYLENKIVLDETGLKGQYDINLKWEYTDRASLARELEHYGFSLQKKKRVVEMLVLLKKNTSKFL